MPAQSSSFNSVASMKFRHKERCAFIALDIIYSVASWSWSLKDGAGSIINFFIFKMNAMEQSKMQLPEWARVAEVELVYKTKIKASERPKVNSSKDICNIICQLWDANKIDLLEEFKVLLLNRGNRIIGVYEVSSGGITGTVADPRLILAAALKSLSVAIVLCHNHPSGNLTPSRADEQLTRKIKEAAAYHDITVLDHIILTSEAYLSFADEGLL